MMSDERTRRAGPYSSSSSAPGAGRSPSLSSLAIQSLGRQPQMVGRSPFQSFSGSAARRPRNQSEDGSWAATLSPADAFSKAFNSTWSPGTGGSLDSGRGHGGVLNLPLLSDIQPGGAAGTAAATVAAARNEAERRKLLLVAFLILFVRYVVATFLSAFFPQVASEQGISGTAEGLIFAAYPLGMAVTSTATASLILRWGTRTSIMMGLVLCGVSTALFGFVPDFADSAGGGVPTLQAMYAGLYFANGLLGGLADTGVLILVSNKFKDKLGVVFASIGTVCGVGCMLGPLLGAVLYSITSSPEWRFRMPFVVTSGFPLLLAAVCPCTLPQIYAADNDDSSAAAKTACHGDVATDTKPKGCRAACDMLLTPAVALSVGAIAISGTIVASLDPTLAYRLSTVGNASTYPEWVDGHPAPFALSSSTVAFFFTYSSVAYVVTSIPVGWFVDRYPTPKAYKLIQTLGFVLLAITFALLGPVRLPAALGGVDLEHALNSMPCAVVALVLKGLGSSGSKCVISCVYRFVCSFLLRLRTYIHLPSQQQLIY